MEESYTIIERASKDKTQDDYTMIERVSQDKSRDDRREFFLRFPQNHSIKSRVLS